MALSLSHWRVTLPDCNSKCEEIQATSKVLWMWRQLKWCQSVTLRGFLTRTRQTALQWKRWQTKRDGRQNRHKTIMEIHNSNLRFWCHSGRIESLKVWTVYFHKRTCTCICSTSLHAVARSCNQSDLLRRCRTGQHAKVDKTVKEVNKHFQPVCVVRTGIRYEAHRCECQDTMASVKGSRNSVKF